MKDFSLQDYYIMCLVQLLDLHVFFFFILCRFGYVIFTYSMTNTIFLTILIAHYSDLTYYVNLAYLCCD